MIDDVPGVAKSDHNDWNSPPRSSFLLLRCVDRRATKNSMAKLGDFETLDTNNHGGANKSETLSGFDTDL